MSIFPTNFPVIKPPEKNESKLVIRENYLDQINELLQRNQILIIQGLGGVGKTTLVREYCSRLTSKDSDSNIR